MKREKGAHLEDGKSFDGEQYQQYERRGTRQSSIRFGAESTRAMSVPGV
jgi:hypothetical protein